MDTESEEIKLARSMNGMVNQLAAEGMPIELIATELKKMMAEIGRHIDVEVVDIGGVKGLEIKGHQGPRPGDMIKPDAKCPGPHVACPACNDPEALCLNPALLARAGTKLEDFPAEGLCQVCAARLVLVNTDGVRSFRLMTETEFLALPDWLRLNFMKTTRRIQQRGKPTGRAH